MQLALVDEGRKSVILDIAGYPPGERVNNQIGAREALPKQYGDAPEYTLVVAGGDTDIKSVPAIELEARIRRDSSDSHSSEGTSGSRLVESAAQAAFNGRGERTRASNVEEGNTCCIGAVDSTTLIEPGSPREKVDESLSSS